MPVLVMIQVLVTTVLIDTFKNMTLGLGILLRWESACLEHSEFWIDPQNSIKKWLSILTITELGSYIQVRSEFMTTRDI